MRSFAIWRASHPVSHPRLWSSPARAGLCWILWSSHTGGCWQRPAQCGAVVGVDVRTGAGALHLRSENAFSINDFAHSPVRRIVCENSETMLDYFLGLTEMFVQGAFRDVLHFSLWDSQLWKD